MHAATKVLSPVRDTLIFSLINACDILTTIIGTTYIGTYEGNGLFTDTYGHPLWVRMVIYKLAICVLFYAALRFFIAVRLPHMYKLAVRTCIALMSLIVIWNLFVEMYTYLYR